MLDFGFLSFVALKWWLDFPTGPPIPPLVHTNPCGLCGEICLNLRGQILLKRWKRAGSTGKASWLSRTLILADRTITNYCPPCCFLFTPILWDVCPMIGSSSNVPRSTGTCWPWCTHCHSTCLCFATIRNDRDFHLASVFSSICFSSRISLSSVWLRLHCCPPEGKHLSH